MLDYFNIADKDVLPIILSVVKGACRDFTACSVENCPGIK